MDYEWTDLPPLPKWHVLAACEGRDPTGRIFFPERGHSATRAKAICARCPVADACLEWALEHEDYGVYGGKTADERAEMRRGRSVA